MDFVESLNSAQCILNLKELSDIQTNAKPKEPKLEVSGWEEPFTPRQNFPTKPSFQQQYTPQRIVYRKRFYTSVSVPTRRLKTEEKRQSTPVDVIPAVPIRKLESTVKLIDERLSQTSKMKQTVVRKQEMRLERYNKRLIGFYNQGLSSKPSKDKTSYGRTAGSVEEALMKTRIPYQSTRFRNNWGRVINFKIV